MTNDDKVKNEKLLYDINKEVAKISVFSSGKIDKYEYITGEEVLHLIKVEQQNKQSLHIPLLLKHLKNKQKQLKSKEKNKQMLLQIKTKDQRLQQTKIIIKVFIKKYLINQLKKNLMK